jgi:hypothetical protein
MGSINQQASAARLRQIDPDRLVPGERLPGHVRDAAGRILIRRGQVLTTEHLQQLAERGTCGLYGTSDWDPDAPPPVEDPVVTITPDELVQALKRKHGVRTGEHPGRRHRRHVWRCQLRVLVQECSDGLVQRREVTVDTCDVSSGGFAFISRQFVHVGTIVYPRFDCLPNRPRMKGIVRYCHHLEAQRHRVGVEFVPLEPDDKPHIT